MANQFNLDFLIAKIEELCSQKQMSVKSALEACGLKRVVVDNMKKGSVPSIDKIFMLANYFDVSVDYLLGRTENPAISDGSLSINQQYIGGDANAQISTIHSDRKSDTIIEDFINLFHKLPIEEKIEIMNLTREKAKEIFTNYKI